MRLPPPTKTEKKTKEKKKLKERPPTPTRLQDFPPAIMQPDQDLPSAYAPAVRFYANITYGVCIVMYCVVGSFCQTKEVFNLYVDSPQQAWDELKIDHLPKFYVLNKFW